MTGRSYIEAAVLTAGVLLAIQAGRIAWRVAGPYGERLERDPRVRVVEAASPDGLTATAFDSDGDFVPDTWHYATADRLVRIDFDDDQNGTIDRRRHFRPDGTVERTESLARGGPARVVP